MIVEQLLTCWTRPLEHGTDQDVRGPGTSEAAIFDHSEDLGPLPVMITVEEEGSFKGEGAPQRLDELLSRQR